MGNKQKSVSSRRISKKKGWRRRYVNLCTFIPRNCNISIYQYNILCILLFYLCIYFCLSSVTSGNSISCPIRFRWIVRFCCWTKSSSTTSHFTVNFTKKHLFCALSASTSIYHSLPCIRRIHSRLIFHCSFFFVRFDANDRICILFPSPLWCSSTICCSRRLPCHRSRPTLPNS